MKARMNLKTFRSTWELLGSFFFKGRTSGGTLQALIHEEASAVGYDRNDIRAR